MLKWQNTYDWDYVKLQPRASYYEEAWGGQFDYNDYEGVLPKVVKGPIGGVADLEKITVLVHPQSLVHSLVQFTDGSQLAQLGTPDMNLPIRYAMTYPHRAESPDKPLDLLTCGALTFAEPDERAFPCLRLARYAAAVGGTACAILNGANEAAVGMFLRGEIGFNDISRRVERALERVSVQYQPSLADILEADKAARRAAL